MLIISKKYIPPHHIKEKVQLYGKKERRRRKKETKLNFCSAALSCPSVLRPASRGGAVILQRTNFSQVLQELD